jgi:hypothetical protein
LCLSVSVTAALFSFQTKMFIVHIENDFFCVLVRIILQRQTAGYNVVVHGRPNKKVSSVKWEPFANQTSLLNRQLGITIHCSPSKACCIIILPEYILGHLLVNPSPVFLHPGLYIQNKTWQFVAVYTE